MWVDQQLQRELRKESDGNNAIVTVFFFCFCFSFFPARGIYILYEDVKSCSCEDLQVLWSLLVESDTALFSKQ
ncbi:hypothetical protein C3L33_07574, partial [Rhododendron williamsianum]